MVGVCALVKKAGDGSCEDVRIGLTHMGSTPLRATAAEEALRGGALDADSIAAAAEQAAEGTEPPGDLNATPDYKRHLARVLTRRALEAAAGGVSLDTPRSRTARPWPGERYLADRGLATAVCLAVDARAAAAAGGRGGRRQDRGRPRRSRARPARG